MIRGLLLNCLFRPQPVVKQTLFNQVQYFARRTAKNKQILEANQEVFNRAKQIEEENEYKLKQAELIKEAMEASQQKEEQVKKVEKPQKSSRSKLNENIEQNEEDIQIVQKKQKIKSPELDKKTTQKSELARNDDDIDDSEVRRIQLLKDQKVQQQIQYERLRKQVMNEERLSKYLSRSGVCSRRQAEKMIKDGLIKVDGKVATSNLPVTPKNNIEIFTQRGEKFAPVKQNAKIWIFYKPRGMICSHDDPLKRPSVFNYIYNNTKIKEPHIIAVGRLDYNSEGLILLTNDGDIAQCLEQPESNIYRQYRVRVQGELDERKLLKLRQGTVINGVQYGPFNVEIDKRQSSNTWLTVGLYTGKNREIRKVMQKFDLRVSRLKRLSYGPYKIGSMLPGQIFETYVNDELKRKIYLYMRKRLQLSQADMKAYLVDKFGEDLFLNNKPDEDLTLDKIAKKAYKELDQNSLRTQLLEQKNEKHEI
ncbi:tRNA rRNA pseudouridine synthase, putative (macronuclear) [Tetrahymena thermophila SB210]|uniref:tRNA rRNA pseudouridine synthase, putative n=1 Tax=Tetrahymena thermophila (strain SB210) TaxID=312017 RepID=I7M8E1_TETTS|nr:tRNA rRNA pseudouridine synthase, putative [Tetrahymena thermophila SB210]EAR97905.2 tRNA rRNA pseudouridine synthase, putative [Tetrahymena thermophila SB210]|eukprot:XP_001018150.2 tRNA rRNA pseudouridine synthase, putative [Tetrahymena thermophila SB210]